VIVESTKFEWRVLDVIGYPSGTIGYADGNRMSRHLPTVLTKLEDEGWEVFSVNVTNDHTAYVVARRPRPDVKDT
jgi:hypothetical protein